MSEPGTVEVPTAPGRAVLAMPGDDRVVYRLVTHDPPNRGDFQPRLGKAAAIALRRPELTRIGLSHYLTLEDARPWKTRSDSRIAAVSLSSIDYYARTGPVSGHLDVWARVEDLVSAAEVVE